MRFFHNLLSLPIAIRAVVGIGGLGGRPGGANGIGFGGSGGNPHGNFDHGGAAGSYDQGSSGLEDLDDNGIGPHNGFGAGNGNGFDATSDRGYGDTHVSGLQGVDSIVSAIRSTDQQVHAASLAIQGMSSDGSTDNVDSTLQQLASSLKKTTAAVQAGGSLGPGDMQSLNMAIKPFMQSIGSLVTHMVTRKDTVAQLCGCRSIENAVNQIRSSTRVMFDGIKSSYSNDAHSFGGSHGGHGGHGFNDLHSFDSGIASYLNQGSAAFGFTNCVNAATQTSTWGAFTTTSATTISVTNIVTQTMTNYATYTSVYTYTSSPAWATSVRSISTSFPGYGHGGGGFGSGGSGGSSHTFGLQNFNN